MIMCVSVNTNVLKVLSFCFILGSGTKTKALLLNYTVTCYIKDKNYLKEGLTGRSVAQCLPSMSKGPWSNPMVQSPAPKINNNYLTHCLTGAESGKLRYAVNCTLGKRALP